MTKRYRVGGGGFLHCVCHCANVFYNVSVSVLVLLVYVCFFSAIKKTKQKKQNNRPIVILRWRDHVLQTNIHNVTDLSQEINYL